MKYIMKIKKTLLFLILFPIIISCGVNIGNDRLDNNEEQICYGTIVSIIWTGDSNSILYVCQYRSDSIIQSSPNNSDLYTYNITTHVPQLIKAFPMTEIWDLNIINGDEIIGIYIDSSSSSSGLSGIWMILPKMIFIDKGNSVAVNEKNKILVIVDESEYRIIIRYIDIAGTQKGEILDTLRFYSIYSNGIDTINDEIAISANFDQIKNDEVMLNIYLLQIKGGTPTRISNNQIDSSPSFSPDGRYIAYCGGNAYYNQTLYVYDKINKINKSYLSYKCDIVSWSPDGKNIAIVNNYNEIIIVDLLSLLQ
jgi:hypothetical protein